MRRAADIRTALILVIGSAVLGVPMGLAWARIAPRLRYEVAEEGVRLDLLSTQAAIGADGRFALLALGIGALLGIVAAFRFRAAVAGSIAGLLVGGLVGSVVAWRTGVAVAPDDVLAAAAGLPAGASVSGGVGLRARGVLLLWPLASLVMLFALVAARDRDRDRDRDR